MAEFRHFTSDTPLAAYLIHTGLVLLEIQYEIKPNGKRQATFVFDASNPEFQVQVDLYNRGEAIINLALYEHVKSGLLDRIMKGAQ